MLHAREGKTYVCIKSDIPWWTKGKEYKVIVTSKGKQWVVDDYGGKWEIDHLKNTHAEFKIKETHSKVETEKLKYTPFDVNKVILRAYNLYDNDAQRLAYIKGYFAK